MVTEANPAGLEITPEAVLKFATPSAGYLCPLSANSFGVEFLKFEIKDYDTGFPVYMSPEELARDVVPPEDLTRCVRYNFPADFLSFKSVKTLLEFRVGSKPLKDFRMVELHYFKDRLVRLYDFTFGFCIPDSLNTWEAIYDVPPNEAWQIKEYIESPYEHKSDSYYFVDDKLVMHNKAEFRYVD